MNPGRRILVIGICLVALLIIRPFFSGGLSLDDALYKKPASLPAPVDVSMEELVQRLELVLKEKFPAILEELQPGLSKEEILAWEEQVGISLTDELRILYQWRNGSQGNVLHGLIPGFRFLSLEEIQELKEIMIKHPPPKNVFMGKYLYEAEMRWVTLFEGHSGQNFHYDPIGGEAYGRFFSFDAEFGFSECSSSLRNWLKANLECFEQDVYFWSGSGDHRYVDEDFDQAIRIWDRYTATPEM